VYIYIEDNLNCKYLKTKLFCRSCAEVGTHLFSKDTVTVLSWTSLI